MARWEFKLPDIGEGVSEGEIVAWAEGVEVGALIKADQPLAEVMTDKATVTITSPKTGKILELGGKVGEIVAVGGNLVVLDTDATSAAPTTLTPSANVGPDAIAARLPSAAGAADPGRAPGAGANVGTAAAVSVSAVSATPSVGQTPASGSAATAVGDIREDLPGMNLSPGRAPAAPAGAKGPGAAAASDYFSEKPLATPATRKLARELDVDLRRVPPTGANGRVTKDDVRSASGAKGGQHASSAPAGHDAPARDAGSAKAPAPAPAREPIAIRAPSAAAQALEERVPLKGVRKKIFDQMARSKHTAAHFTFVEECDVTALRDLRERLKPRASAQGIKLSFLPFIVKAVVAALKRHPDLNGAFDESTNEIVRRRYYNIGIAAATEAGLLVPVVKDADRRSLLGVGAEIERLSNDARDGKIKLEDIQGSTFTITSLGQQGGLFATPILNFPEVGILGVHQMKQKPVVRDGQIVIGEVMLLSLSFDHRIIDGHVGAAFAYDVIRFLEHPDDLFLEMA